MSDRRIRKVVILGGGTAGWMTAAALAKVNSPPQFEVTLIESDEIGIIGVGEATIPTIHWFNRLVDLDEAEFLRETRATYKLGIEFVGWNGAGSRYFHPFGRYGAPADQQMFFHRWIRANLAGDTSSHQDYSLTTVAALAGKFGPPANDPNSIFSTLGCAYHFDAGLYAGYLRRYAEARGVARVEGKVEKIAQDPETGFVTSLTTQRRRAGGRPVHRLLRPARDADRRDPAGRLRGLVALAALRPRFGGAVRARRRSDPLYPRDRA